MLKKEQEKAKEEEECKKVIVYFISLLNHSGQATHIRAT